MKKEPIHKFASNNSTILDCAGVTFRWASSEPETLPILENVDFKVSCGEFVSIIGPSGCGKSTLLNVLAGVRQADSGCINFYGSPVVKPRQEIGLVFQDYGLYPWLNIKHNIEFGMRINGKSKKDRQAKSNHLLKQIELFDHAKKYPHELSGGMRQRVAIARALANDPEIILMDEPFGALDYQTRIAMNELLRDIWGKFQKTIIFVTHDIEESILLSDRIFLMSSSPGRVVKILDNDLPRPRDVMSEEFGKIQQDIRNHLARERDKSSLNE